MACLLQPECNFMHGFFRCKLPVEAVDVEVKITSMQGTHIFRQDRTTQVIKCISWNTRLCPHPTIIKKMETFLEVKGKMGLMPASQFRPPLPDTNPSIRKDKNAEKRKRAAPNRFRPAAPEHTTACSPITEAPQRSKTDVPDSRSPPSVPVHKSTPWPGVGKVSGNLFEDRNWLLPPNYLDNNNRNENKTENGHKNMTGVISPRPPIKEEEDPKMSEQSVQKCSWEPDCPFCESQEKTEEQNKMQQQKMSPKPELQKPQARRPKTLNLNMTKAKQQWEAEMESLNSKYNLNCFSDSELDSESDEGQQYHYEHGYETLI